MKKQWLCLLLAAVLVMTCCPTLARAEYQEMTFSDGVVNYIKQGEGFSEKPINDGTGWYIGYGCLINPADYPNGITEAQADALLRSNMQQFADYINLRFLKKHGVSVTQGQFDAMIAMSYALGLSWMNAGNRLPTYIVNGVGNYTDQQIASAFAAWCHVGGAVNTVALKRRIMEANMFLYDNYDFSQYWGELGWNWVILDANGGKNALSDVAVYKTGGIYGALPEASRSGWYFAGWEKTDGELLLPSDTVNANLNLKARWSTTPVTPPQPVETPAPAESPAPAETPAPTETTQPEAPEELPEEVFPDVPATQWYAGYVAALVRDGVIHGYDDGTFRPDSEVTWGQALKLILLASGFAAKEPVETEEDAPPAHWASGYLAFAEKKEYLKKDAVADLDAAITRDALADLCAAALELTDVPAENPYADSSRESVLRLFAAEIMEGSFDEGGRRVFKGAEALKRSEVCAVLVRVQAYVAKTWILFAGRRVPIQHDLKTNPYDAAAFSVQNGRTVYDDGATKVRYGIDVSKYQGEIDWKKVAADGVEFAIIRCGYRGSATGSLNEDPYFQDNIRGALENGIEVGVYFFSQALNVAEAMEELNYTLELIRGWDVTLPVVYDWEQYGGRSSAPDWNAVTDCIVAFCDGVAAAGYQPMTYYNPSMAYLRIDLQRLTAYPIWLAHYAQVTNYYYDFQMWQYTSSGHVDGIEGRVDMDILFGTL